MNLLRIVDVDDDPDHRTFSCGTQIFELLNAPRSKALSYTCGRSNFVLRIENGKVTALDEPGEVDVNYEQIFCNGRHVRFFASLAFRIMYLLIMYAYELDTWVWVECFCIDQEILTEKAQQVQMMKKIFSTADEVLVWLVESFGDEQATEAVIEVITTLGSALEKWHDDPRNVTQHLDLRAAFFLLFFFPGPHGPPRGMDDIYSKMGYFIMTFVHWGINNSGRRRDMDPGKRKRTIHIAAPHHSWHLFLRGDLLHLGSHAR